MAAWAVSRRAEFDGYSRGGRFVKPSVHIVGAIDAFRRSSSRQSVFVGRRRHDVKVVDENVGLHQMISVASRPLVWLDPSVAE